MCVLVCRWWLLNVHCQACCTSDKGGKTIENQAQRQSRSIDVGRRNHSSCLKHVSGLHVRQINYSFVSSDFMAAERTPIFASHCLLCSQLTCLMCLFDVFLFAHH